MSINSEREVTNKSFKAKMSEILSVLSGETYTPTPAANDGETLNCKTFEYFMNELKENIGGGGGGSSLPAVTSDDNGDVLQVIEGAWAKGPAPAADNDFLVNFTLNLGQTTSVVSETTFAQIKAAYDQGKNIIAKADVTLSIGSVTSEFDMVYHITQIDDSKVVFFGFTEITEGEGTYSTIVGTSSGYSFNSYQ